MAETKLPPGPLKVFSANTTTAILDANGNEVVGWLGFDDSNRTRAEHDALAHHIVRCVNDHAALVRAAKLVLAASKKGLRGTPVARWAGTENGLGQEFGVELDAALSELAKVVTPPGVAVAPDNRISVDRGALQMALNVLCRAGKNEVADALAESADAGVKGLDGGQQG